MATKPSHREDDTEVEAERNQSYQSQANIRPQSIICKGPTNVKGVGQDEKHIHCWRSVRWGTVEVACSVRSYFTKRVQPVDGPDDLVEEHDSPCYEKC